MPPFRSPSPALIGLAAHATGVVAGLGAGFPAVLAGGTAAIVLPGRRRWIGVVVAVGALSGAATRHADRDRCASVIAPGAISAHVAVVVPAAPRRIGSLRLLDRPCRGTIPFRPGGSDTLWAGWRGTVRGNWRQMEGRWRPPDGLLGVMEAQGRVGPADWVESLRNGTLRSIGRLFGARAGMIEALVLGSRGTIDPDLQRAFARSGLVHLLSISGFHVGLIWAWVQIILGLLGVRVRSPVAAALVLAYIGFIGLPPPAVRAGLLATIGALARFGQRNPSAGPLFALCAWLVLVVDPWALFDLGAWLSIGSLWGATAAVRWSDRAFGTGAGWRMMAGSVGATLATAPITAWWLGTVALAGIALNPIAIPLAAAAVPAVLASLLVAPILPRVAASVAAGGGALLAALEALARRGAAIPGAALSFEPGPLPALLALLVVAGAAVAFGGRATAREAGRRIAWGLGVGLALGLVWQLVPVADSRPGLALHFLDVGQGDAALVQTASGHWVLIDAGPSDDRFDAGLAVVVPYLERQGVHRLEAVVLSHGHRDHYGGLMAVLGAIEVGRVFEPAEAVPDPHYLALLDAMADRGIPWIPVRSGTTFAVDEVRFTALHPDSTWESWGTDLNEDSAVLVVNAGGFRALFAGDAGLLAEARIGSNVQGVDLLKVGHHGSRTATGVGWLARLRPAAAIISVGRTNRYGHPAPETVARLDAAGIVVWRTDREGTVTVRIEHGQMVVRGRRGSAAYPLRGPDSTGTVRHGAL